MNKKFLQQLVIQSYTNGKLDPEKVNRIADLLTKKELQLYIKGLKNWEKQQKVIVDVPVVTNDIKGKIQELFPGKQIVINTDPSLILGVRIHQNDNVYEMSLKDALEKITEHVEELYD
ncbi:MAG: hypothetical protein KatS3mg089_0467 [Patescibacteria group bacterium]|nr:MAG: hypothetical protein KatS3mg089_0467 [Patescibacteria group bacterium]